MPTNQIHERTSSDGNEAREFTATVTEVREHSRVGGKPLFQIALDTTEFMATAGDDCTLGVLLAKARSGAVLEVPITAVTRDANGEVWHSTMKPLQPGTVVLGRVVLPQ